MKPVFWRPTFDPPQTPLTRRLLVYFHSAAYTEVPCKKWLLADEPAAYGDGGIEQWDRECHERGSHPQNRGRFLTRDYAETAEEEADEQATGITKKDTCRVEIVTKEAEERANQGRGSKGERDVVLQEGRNKSCAGSEKPQAGGESVNAIDEVQCIGAKQQPKHRERKAPPRVDMEAARIGQTDAGPKRTRSGDALCKDLLPGTKGQSDHRTNP